MWRNLDLGAAFINVGESRDVKGVQEEGDRMLRIARRLDVSDVGDVTVARFRDEKIMEDSPEDHAGPDYVQIAQ